MQKTSLILLLVVSLTCLFLLSSFSSILAGYQISPHRDENQSEPAGTDANDESLIPLFKVTPIIPQFYWRIWSADCYTGLTWVRSTNETILDELPIVHNANPLRNFTVEINTTQSEFFLPLPSSQSGFESVFLPPNATLKLHMDALGHTYKLTQYGQTQQIFLTYNVSWNEAKVDDKLISLSNVSKEILDKYLQLPNISLAVRKLAQDLEDPAYSVLDQILADVQYLRTNFVYDSNSSPERIYGEISQGSDVSSYLERGRGVCIDAATALTVILRVQKIPARISVGFKPGEIEGGKLAYYSKGAHALTEVLLPPFGWVQFDATPQMEDTPLVKVSPFKKEALPGSRLFYQVSIRNRLNSTEKFRLVLENELRWSAEAAPGELRVEAGQTADAVLEVIVPESASFGEKNTLSLTAISTKRHDFAFSLLAIAEVENTTSIPTTTTLKGVDETVVRGDSFWLNGTVLDVTDAGVDNMTVFAFLTKGRKAEGTVAGKGFSKQGKFQIACTVPNFLEVGDYRIILLSLGTNEYASSNGESATKVAAWTSIELGSEKGFLVGYGAIHGSLSWDNGTGLANAPVSIRVISSAKQSEVRKLDNLTSVDGTFRIETAFEDAGEYEVQAAFSGTEHILGSNVTGIVNLKRGQPKILISAEKVAVRGENWTISGKVQSEEIGIWGEPLTLTFDQQPLAKIETRENGTFFYSFFLNPEKELGAHVIVVSLIKTDETAIHDVAIKSKTNLNTKISDVEGGMFLLLSASLSDDHNVPIQGAEISVDNYGLSLKTGENGTLHVLLDNIKLWPDNSTLTAKFEGSELYLPVATEKRIVLEQWTSLPLLVPLAAPSLVILAVVYSKQLSKKRQMLQQVSQAKKAEKRETFEAKPTVTQKWQPLRIILPGVASQFPLVWGVEEKLRMEIVLDEGLLEKIHNREIEISIDGEKGTSIVFSKQGRAEYSCVFTEKGERKISAHLAETSEHRALNAELTLRVVDYEEEILRLYNEFLRRLSSQGIDIRKEMTAREIELLVLSESSFDWDSLREVTACFENAEYSSRLMTRADYENLYLSLKELKIDVE
jgi:hypothetical protein